MTKKVMLEAAATLVAIIFVGECCFARRYWLEMNGDELVKTRRRKRMV